MYSGDEFYGEEITSPLERPTPTTMTLTTITLHLPSDPKHQDSILYALAAQLPAGSPLADLFTPQLIGWVNTMLGMGLRPNAWEVLEALRASHLLLEKDRQILAEDLAQVQTEAETLGAELDLTQDDLDSANDRIKALQQQLAEAQERLDHLEEQRRWPCP